MQNCFCCDFLTRKFIFTQNTALVCFVVAILMAFAISFCMWCGENKVEIKIATIWQHSIKNSDGNNRGLCAVLL